MLSAMKMYKKKIRKERRRRGVHASIPIAQAAAEEITISWDDGSWFESWVVAQAPGKDEMMNWIQELTEAELTTEYECCRAAFLACIFLELLDWDMHAAEPHLG